MLAFKKRDHRFKNIDHIPSVTLCHSKKKCPVDGEDAAQSFNGDKR
jgi:hypothetical protein